MKQVCILITVLLNISVFTAFFIPLESGSSPVIRADLSSAYMEVKDTFRDIKETWDGMSRFFTGISSAMKAISRIIDPAALVLLAAVLLFSAGFSAIGVPKGRAAFFASLITLNVLWFLWEKSMHPDSYGFFGTMLRINLMLLLPYFIIVIFFRLLSTLTGRAWRKCIVWFRISILKRTKEREELVFLSDRFRESGTLVNESLARDISSGADKRIALSAVTRRHLDDLTRIIRKIED